jgi:DNA-binding IclR family transcriptional regulator
MTSSTDAKWPLRSVTVTLRLIKALQELDGAGVTELANHLDIAKSTAYNHLRTLEQYHYVIETGGVFRLSLKFLDHGGYVRENDQQYQAIRTKIRHIAEKTGELCQFVTEEHGVGVIVFRESGSQAVSTRTRIGSREYLHQITAGKVILAYLSQERVDAIIEQRGLPAKTEATVATPDELFTELSEIRDRGYALDKDEHIRGLQAIGVPVKGEADAVLGAISVASPTYRAQSESRGAKIADFLLELANELELDMRYSQ